MEKAMGFASGSTQPSAPPPSAPPSYEEAVENAAQATSPLNPQPSPQPVLQPTVQTNVQPNIPPYPVGPSSMPIAHTAVPVNKPTVPCPPHYVNTNILTEVRVEHPVIYCLTSHPTKMVCPTCLASIKTRTISDHQPSAHLCCIVLCLIGCCLCSCLPYCMNSFTTVHHFCPKCKNYIGMWKG